MNWNVLSSGKLFFTEWKDDTKVYVTTAWVTMILMVTLLWFQSNIPDLKTTADIYWNFLLIGIIMGAIDLLWENNPIFGFLFTGRTFKDAGLALLFGGIIGFLLQYSSFVIAIPQAINIPTGLATFFFVVIIAPYAEEKFFRASFYPSSITIFSGILNKVFRFKEKDALLYAGIFSILLVSISFAFFHLAVFGANPSLVFSAFLFSVIAIVGNRISESFYFGYAMHLVNNFLAIGGFAVLMGMI